LEHSTIFINDLLSELNRPPETLRELFDPGKCTCLAPINVHVHDPNYIDVSAVKYNDTGVVVKQGASITISPKLDGKITWGKAGLFFGDDLITGPDGDRTATPATHRPWIDPPMRGYPIGGLIGVIFP